MTRPFFAILALALAGACTEATEPAPRADATPGAGVATQAGYVAGRPVIERVSVTVRSANLRAGPGTRHAVIGGAQGGQTLGVIARRGGWLEVARGERTAWIAARLTGPEGTGAATAPESEAGAPLAEENPLLPPPPDPEEEDARRAAVSALPASEPPAPDAAAAEEEPAIPQF
jgi:hypothetical protein